MIAFLVEHLASIVGFALGVLLLSRELRERRPTSVTIAWLLAVALVPYVGVPLYLVFGGRKLARRAASKKQLLVAKERIEAERRDDAPHGGTSAAVDRLLDGMGVLPAKNDNAVTLLTTGEAAYASLIELIDGASVSVHVTTFILGGDAVGDAILERLTERAKAGVEVRLLLDALFARRPHGAGLDALRAAGGRIAFFMPLVHIPFRGHANLRNHRKLAVADGARAVVGGMNLAEEYMGPTPFEGRWRDIAMRVDGSLAEDLEAVFRADWAFAAGEELAPKPAPRAFGSGTSSLRAVPSGPDVATDTLYDVLLTALFSATRRIWIATPYFVPDDALVRALVLACRRGVDVQIVLPARSNHLSADLAGGPSLRAVEEAGGAVRPYLPGMLHAKSYLVDDAIAVVGSANFDMRSLFLNYEIGIFLRSAAETTRLAAWFEEVFQDCAAERPEPGRLRAAAEDVARLVGPLV